MDSVGRLGGDEFALLIPGAARPEALTLVGRLNRVLADRAPSSLGIACFPTDGTDSEELQRHADAELYAAKEGRRADHAPSRRELSWATALAQAVDTRIAVPDEHSTAVARYAAVIAEEMGWQGTDLALLRMAAMLHDVGKVGIPDSILRKAGPLTEDEFDQMRLAPVTGAELVGRVEGLGAIVPVDLPRARAHGRLRLPRGPARRRDPARLADHRRRGRLRRDDDQPPVPRGDVARGRARRAAPLRRHASSTPPASTRSSAPST